MKFGIITHPNSLNYGDDIQSLAAYKLLNKVDYLLDRENLNSPPSDNKIKLLCNGWFMEKPTNWPPANNIEPLFISFHITHNNKANKIMLDKDNISYFKKYEPIGCRDHYTVSLFNRIGIKAYYSGCITLTLENETKPFEKSDEILFVDPFNKNLPEAFRKKMFNKLVPDSIKNNIVHINHTHLPSSEPMIDKLKYAENLILRYSKAHLVVTSRIHVALPCIALGTPVLFMDVGFNLKNSRNRFSGIINYFNKMDNSVFPYTGLSPISLLFRKLHLYNYYYNNSKIKYDWENPKPNLANIEPIVKNIKRTISDFISD